ncbi:hypothetical protein JCM19232_1045 [Vibrio ishigakensis]|uniref:Lipoprotein n=1 Tax=Vibrio ishigakensis TaxID=1481914 RepID=A0A0B8PC36_9VIBR|nr:hypothetical protein JCM19232_1045 [Vibrio ishigakensis]
MKKWILVLAFLLAGCSSGGSNETKTYLLPSTEPSTELVFDSVSIKMPSYLQGPGLYIVCQKLKSESLTTMYGRITLES